MRRLLIPLSVLVLVLGACAGDTTPEVDSTEPDVDASDDEPVDDPDDDGANDPDDAADDDAADAAPEPDETDADDTGDGDGDAEPDAEPAAGPDPDEVEQPCAAHEERQGEAFVELAAPVDDQPVSGEVDLVGCSSVPEGTIQFRVLDGDGATLHEGFTTATCGGPCIGEFRETVDLASAAGEPVAYVQVFWEDLSDGSDRDLLERIVVME